MRLLNNLKENGEIFDEVAKKLSSDYKLRLEK